jgi:acetyl-CoA carboxylase alpha subunit
MRSYRRVRRRQTDVTEATGSLVFTDDDVIILTVRHCRSCNVIILFEQRYINTTEFVLPQSVYHTIQFCGFLST